MKQDLEFVFNVGTTRIIDYVMKHPGTTSDMVSKHLRKENTWSRLTTLKYIDRLILMGIIIDKREDRYFHSLFYNESFSDKDIKKLEQKEIEDVKKSFEPLYKLFEAKNNVS